LGSGDDHFLTPASDFLVVFENRGSDGGRHGGWLDEPSGIISEVMRVTGFAGRADQQN
jgi:hypothetical protein